MDRHRNLGYALFGGGGAAGSLYAGQACAGACTGCSACIAFIVLLAGWTLLKNHRNDGKGDANDMAAGDY